MKALFKRLLISSGHSDVKSRWDNVPLRDTFAYLPAVGRPAAGRYLLVAFGPALARRGGVDKKPKTCLT